MPGSVARVSQSGGERREALYTRLPCSPGGIKVGTHRLPYSPWGVRKALCTHLPSSPWVAPSPCLGVSDTRGDGGMLLEFFASSARWLEPMRPSLPSLQTQSPPLYPLGHEGPFFFFYFGSIYPSNVHSNKY